MFNMSINDIRKNVIKKTTPHDWRGNIINELLFELDGELNINLDVNETKDILRHVCTIYSTSNHFLWTSIPSLESYYLFFI